MRAVLLRERQMHRLRTLGVLDLQGSDGQALGGVLAQSRRMALLVYLAIATPRGFHRRDTLLALFWPEQDTERARNALSQAVHFLRRQLGADAISGKNGEALGLARDAFWCDAVAFDEALDHGQLAEGLELYRGDFLHGFHIADASVEFERWLEGERKRLAGRCADALETLAAEREAAGDSAGAVVFWRRLATRDPYSSRVALRLMGALAATGDSAAAVQHAHVHETLLRDDLRVAPDPEVARLVRELQSGRVVTADRSSGPREPAPSRAGLVQAQRQPWRLGSLFARATVVLALGAGIVLARGAGTSDAPPIRSLAVLPIENLSGDSTHQAFVDGMHDVLITELGRYPDLSVTSRTSVVQYQGTRKPLPEIARELGVDGIVEGAILFEGRRFRMTAQLVHGPGDRHLWAQAYERDLRDVLILQGELASAIAHEVRTRTVPAERRPVPAEGLLLRQLYLRGAQAEVSRSLGGILTAKASYRRAIEQDANYALAYAGLARAYYLLADYDYAPAGPALDSAREMARAAVALDSTLPESRTSLAMLLATDRKFDAAERELRYAIAIAPSNALAHYWYSNLLVALGRGEEALREADRVEQLDPFAPRGVTAMQRYAHRLISGEHAELKVPVAQRPLPVLKLEPGEPIALAWEALDLAEQGQCADAARLIQQARQFAGNSMRLLQYVAAVDWWCGRRQRARALTERMKRLPSAYDQGARIAMMHTLFGELDSAFVWLPRTQWTLGSFAGLSADRRWDPLRSDARFSGFLQEVGLRPAGGTTP
jgi:TolB-like protein/DNA-binding SARP family transcriptional activator/Tfp pilus assembly protein PilF